MRILTLFLSVLLMVPCVADAKTTDVTADVSSTEMPINITAETLEVDQDAGLAVFEGMVSISYTNLSLTSDRLNVVYEKGASGDGGQTSDIARILAFGNVTLTQGETTATAGEAVYLPKNDTITLKGHVVLLRAGSILKGSALTYNTVTKNMKLHAEPQSGRVKASFALGKKDK